MLRAMLGVAAAIAITATMDASGLSAFSALPLLPLLALLWWWERLSRREIGLVAGRLPHYANALLYPIVVMAALAAIAAAAGVLDPSGTDWTKACTNLAMVTLSTFLAVILTEEGFFRGWLWGSLARTGKSPAVLLCWTSLAFALWHVSVIVLPTGFDVPARQVPIFLLNAAVLGAVWGVLRLVSGSVIVASASHGLWNGLAYVLFGFGTHSGALGIRNTALYGPEVGLLGLALNLFGLAALLWCYRGRFRISH
jgi:membrane protease YdiL (CAAX protease family)